jgi:uncharacterized protein (TIGR02599 family)
MKYSRASHRKHALGFSLIELLVSVAVLGLIMVLVFQMLERTQNTWKRARNSVAEYKDARVAFESITRRLSQATLNTYWGYVRRTNGLVTSFERKSDLHFVSGPSSVLLGPTPPPNAGNRVTHSMFFQAPTGYTEIREGDRLKYGKFPNLLNSWGYFVEFGTDQGDRPAFINQLDNAPRVRARYRLIEYCQASEGLQIYAEKLGDDTKTSLAPAQLYRWFLNDGTFGCNCPNNYPVGNTGGDTLLGRTTRVVAENILALIVLPAESLDEELRDDLAPKYYYDSRAWQNTSGGLSGSQINTAKSRHVLPPIVDVLMVAVDEADFNRYTQNQGIEDISGFVNCDFTKDLFVDSARLDEDLKTLEDRLTAATPAIKFRVFRASVRIREAKWGGFVDNATAGGGGAN